MLVCFFNENDATDEAGIKRDPDVAGLAHPAHARTHFTTKKMSEVTCTHARAQTLTWSTRQSTGNSTRPTALSGEPRFLPRVRASNGANYRATPMTGTIPTHEQQLIGWATRATVSTDRMTTHKEVMGDDVHGEGDDAETTTTVSVTT